MIGGAYVFLTPWIPGFNVFEAYSNFCPILVDFLNLPMESHPYKKDLFSVLGKVLHVQDDAKRPAVKTIVVFELSKLVFSKITYKIGQHFYTVDVNFLNIPNRRNLCKNFGQIMRGCPSMPTPLVATP